MSENYILRYQDIFDGKEEIFVCTYTPVYKKISVLKTSVDGQLFLKGA